MFPIRTALTSTMCLLLACVASAQAPYDLLLKGGHVIDARNKIDAIRDVAIRDGKIAEVAAAIAPARANKVVDVTGLYVTPGIVDMHVHAYATTGVRGVWAGDSSILPDGFTLRSGVTTVMDAGSSGWRNFADFKDRVIDRSRTRILALVNIVGRGMAGQRTFEQDVDDMDPKATADVAMRYKDVVVGIKTAHFDSVKQKDREFVAVDRAVEAGKIANVLAMMDIANPRPGFYEEMLIKHLRPGDITTHMYSGNYNPYLDDGGKLLPYLFEARKRGVLFDTGHGGGSFLFRRAIPAIRQNFPPDSISTDLHTTSMNAGMKDMLNLMSRFLNMGLPLTDVIQRSTWNPARMIRREEFGHLSVGAGADIAVLRLVQGDVGFVDSAGARLRGKERLVCEMTVLGGRVVYDLNGITREDWDKLDKNYGSQGDPRWDATRGQGPLAPLPPVKP